MRSDAAMTASTSCRGVRSNQTLLLHMTPGYLLRFPFPCLCHAPDAVSVSSASASRSTRCLFAWYGAKKKMKRQMPQVVNEDATSTQSASTTSHVMPFGARRHSSDTTSRESASR